MRLQHIQKNFLTFKRTIPATLMISILIYFLAFIYGLFIFLLIVGWYEIRSKKHGTLPIDKGISLLIPFRNEEQQLNQLLDSLTKQDYGQVLEKVLFIDDHSNDNSKNIIEKYSSVLPIEILELPSEKEGKKAAVEFGWRHINSEWIIQLDADTTSGKTGFKI